ncbi:LPXTG cell wall anchor domain-containing protein [Neobacillus sedimentimangrovi]|jgi:LPXTG-motif cell wall-anchored protein|uniref:LPXTG cell wall anchor domain-containing protein n=1 Tax=Neobacillus sedimentimangrovi TaxID=2699460 RepID=A0ABS8QMA5_9BACI|nr:LPXTG cell wall anchor domain-containing protein [Neobacillus sedimentimangrovi]MCD4840288.1 LPXTG cell wall anchor domain-containing protein [Neobacillus sedimentimangrovi]
MRKIYIYLSIFLLFLSPTRVYGETNNYEIDLTTDPSTILIDLTNVKPGDWVTRDLIIKNNGKQDFNYIFSSKFLSGSRIFYNKLDLTIKDNSDVLFEGKLFEFKQLPPRLLKSKHNEKLQIHVKVPIDLTNEFQGLETEFQFKLYVEGTLGGVLPADGPKLPVTGTNMYNILIAGGLLVFTGIFLQIVIRKRNGFEKHV